jgi:phage shock protein PspC (stress-responsive transcriptional regulator)
MTSYTTPVRAPLRRSAEGRVLGGVAAGLARHLGIDPLLLRIAFVVVPLSLLPYLRAWILLPTDGEGDGSEGGGAAVLVGTGLVVLGGFLALEQADPGWLDLDGRLIAPILLGLTGLALIARGVRN